MRREGSVGIGCPLDSLEEARVLHASCKCKVWRGIGRGGGIGIGGVRCGGVGGIVKLLGGDERARRSDSKPLQPCG
jgi:hypothetical protein